MTVGEKLRPAYGYSYYRIRCKVYYNNYWRLKRNAIKALKEIRRAFSDDSAKVYKVKEVWKEVKG